MSSIFNEIKNLPPELLVAEGIITPARKSGYVCPMCENGTGESGDGLTLQHYDWGWNFHCFKCEKNFTPIDLIGMHLRVDLHTKAGLSKIAEFAKEKFNIGDANNSFRFTGRRKTAAPMAAKVDTKPKKNYSEFYTRTQNQLESFVESQGGNWRGLPLKTLREVGAGFTGMAIILPYDDYHYFERKIYESDKPKQQHGENAPVYDPFGADSGEPVIVVEGEIDALSIKQVCNSLSVIALGGTTKWSKLIDWAADQPHTPKFILVFDNDEAGRNAAKRAMEGLKAAGIPAVSEILSEIEGYDANKLLQEDSEELFNLLQDVYIEGAEKLKAAEIEIAAQVKRGRRTKFSDYFKFEFEREVERMKKYSARKTGFDNIDAEQAILPGLYVIGGLPSLGKTTFTWQLLEQMASAGETCVYCSYEMAQGELFSKSIAREVFLKARQMSPVGKTGGCNLEAGDTFSSMQIRCGEGNNVSREVIEEFKQMDDRDFCILDFSIETIDDLIAELKEICEESNEPPIVAVDYLQFIPSTQETAKAAVDEIVRKLKNFQRETDTTIFLISSLNRQNYSQPIAFESFKESGGIEFSADVIWGLQLLITEKLTGDEITKRKAIDAEKKKIPREIRLKCLKNRHGRLYDLKFNYYPKVEYFEPVDETVQQERDES